MGYCSQVALKTTTEGYLVLKRFNDSIKFDSEKPLRGAEIMRTKAGFYKISFDDVKWYDSYSDVQNFLRGMDKLEYQDIPYVFIRIGEDYDDIEYKENYTEDMPEELCEFNPDISIYDCDSGDYDFVEE